MTEPQRIVAEGVVGREFLEPEVRSGFLVTAGQKKVWAVELDLLRELHEVCERHGLTYYLIFGSLLGAMRHGGFIPWDDDMDVCLPRGDYERLLELGGEFRHPYFLQTPTTDPGFFFSHAKLRNSETSALDYPFLHQGFNMGIFIDVLPLDEFDPVDGAGRFDEIARLVEQNSVAMRLSHPSLSERDRARVAAYGGGDPMARYAEIQRLARMDEGKGTGFVSLLAAVTYGLERDVFPTACFLTREPIFFEGLDTFVPSGYEDVLTVTYGAWGRLPPVGDRKTTHPNLSFDADASYLKN